jgi:hypothetical protein
MGDSYSTNNNNLFNKDKKLEIILLKSNNLTPLFLLQSYCSVNFVKE